MNKRLSAFVLCCATQVYPEVQTSAFLANVLEEKSEKQQDIAKIMEGVVKDAQKLFDDLSRMVVLLKKYNIPYTSDRVDFSKKFADESGASAGIGFDLLFSHNPHTFNGFEVIVYLDAVPEFLRQFFVEVSKPMAQKMLAGNVTVSDDMRIMTIRSSPIIEYLVKMSLMVKDFALKTIMPQEFAAQVLLMTLKCAHAPESTTAQGLLGALPGFWLDMAKGIKIGDKTLLAFLERGVKEAQDVLQWDFEDRTPISEKEIVLVLKGLTAALMQTAFEYLEKRDAFFKDTKNKKQKKDTSKMSKEFNEALPGFKELVAKGTKRVLDVTSRYEPFKKMSKPVLATLKPVTFLLESLGIPVTLLLGVDEKEISSAEKALDTEFSLLPDLDTLTVTDSI